MPGHPAVIRHVSAPDDQSRSLTAAGRSGNISLSQLTARPGENKTNSPRAILLGMMHRSSQGSRLRAAQLTVTSHGSHVSPVISLRRAHRGNLTEPSHMDHLTRHLTVATLLGLSHHERLTTVSSPRGHSRSHRTTQMQPQVWAAIQLRVDLAGLTVPELSQPAGAFTARSNC